ncbi:LOW QUALITY PROTEIN: hypothetical protein U9M48_013176, partial [Paspalum notatum var. saurae]
DQRTGRSVGNDDNLEPLPTCAAPAHCRCNSLSSHQKLVAVFVISGFYSMSSNASESLGTDRHMEIHTSQIQRRTRSQVWEHFEVNLMQFDGELKAICKYCGLGLNTKSGTSSLRGHVANSCPTIDPSIRNTFRASISKKPAEQNFMFDPIACREGMINFANHAEIPFLKFEDPFFSPWINTMQPTFKVRGRQTIHNDCLKKYEEMERDLQVELLSLDSCVSLTSDLDILTEFRLHVTAHFIDAEFKIKKKIIWFKELEYPHTGYAIEEEIVRCVIDWEIKDKMFTLTMDNASDNTSACELLTTDHKHDLLFEGKHLHIRCCAHILNILVQDGMRIIHTAIDKIHELLKHIDSSPSRLQAFNSIANGKGLPSKHGIYLDIPTRWNSTYKMLREALVYKAVLNSYALKYYEAAPSEDECEKAEAICEFLKAFEELTLSVSAHREPTEHKFLPLVLCIQHALKDPAWQTTNLLKELAASMCSKFEKHWEPSEDNHQTGANSHRNNKEIAFNIALVCKDNDQMDLEWMRKYFAQYEKQHPRTGSMNTMTRANEPSVTKGSPLVGKRKLEDEFNEYMSQMIGMRASRSEIDEYLEEKAEVDRRF